MWAFALSSCMHIDASGDLARVALAGAGTGQGSAASRLGLPDYCRFWARCVHTWMARMSQLVVPQGCPEPDAQRTQQQELAEMRPARGCNTTASAQAGRSGQGRGVNGQQTAATACSSPSSPRAGGVQEACRRYVPADASICLRISHQPSAISHQPSAIGHRPSAIGHQPWRRPALSRLSSGRFDAPSSTAATRRAPCTLRSADAARRAVDHW